MKRISSLLLLVPLVVFSPMSYGENKGSQLYQKYCASCHGIDRTGTVAPPLFPLFLRKYKEKKLINIIRNGLPATQMPAFKNLSQEEIKEIISYIKTPANVNWSLKDINKSLHIYKQKGKNLSVKNIKNVVAVVERGKNKVWIIEETEILDKFDFKNVHGGLKFSPSGWKVYIPSRDGWIGRYDINKGRLYGKVRACIYLRNITLDRTGKYILASCWLPKSVVILDSENLKPLKIQKEKGLISGIYSLYSKNEAVFTFRDIPQIGFFSTENFSVSYKQLPEAYQDFFIDPFEEFIIGTSRNGTKLSVYSFIKEKEIFSANIEGMPHLASATVWYKNGKFFFATPHITKPFVTVWNLYNWRFVKKVDIGGNGFFVRTHPTTPYLWTDDGKDKIVLIEKEDFSVKILNAEKGKRVIHTEFNGDGNLAYVSLYNKNGAVLIYDSVTLEMKKRIPADIPIGKYNIINKSRKYQPILLGKQIFMEKCWGCHHQTQEAFAPSFKWIVNHRTDSQILSQIANPEQMYKKLGYKRNAMPKIKLSQYELRAILSYMKQFKERKDVKNN